MKINNFNYAYILMIPLLICSCSKNDDGLSTKKFSKIDVTNKQYFNMGNYHNSPIGRTISLSNASFYYFKDDICSFWQRDKSAEATSNYQVTFYYYKIIDKIVFKCVFEDIYEPITKPLNKIDELNAEFINDFNKEHPLFDGMCFEYLCEAGNDTLLIKKSSNVDDLYATMEAAQEFGITFVD